jgi:colicin import membrane protein
MTLRAFVLSVILHVLMLGLLVFSFDFGKQELVIQPQDVMKAVSVDSRQVDREINRLREIDKKKEQAGKKKQQELEDKVKELERKAKAATEQRTEEEKRIADLTEKKEKERKEAETEEKRVADLRQQKEELEKKKQAEEDARKKKEAEETEKKKRAETDAKKKAEQEVADAKVIDGLQSPIKAAITKNFNVVGLPPGLSCKLLIRMVPGGEVVGVQVAQSSGNPVFDQRARDAVYQASPLPVPTESRIFEKVRDLQLIFAP